MRHHLLRSATVGLAILAGTTFATAQNQAPDQEKAKQASPPETTNQAPVVQPVFVNGKLAVPGAPADSQTEPAKFSARNDAIDKLNQNAVTLKQLNEAQRRTLYQLLGSSRETTGSTASSGNSDIAQVGVVLPISVELQALPADATRQMSNIAIYAYARVANKVLLVAPENRAVVAVLGS